MRHLDSLLSLLARLPICYRVFNGMSCGKLQHYSMLDFYLCAANRKSYAYVILNKAFVLPLVMSYSNISLTLCTPLS